MAVACEEHTFYNFSSCESLNMVAFGLFITPFFFFFFFFFDIGLKKLFIGFVGFIIINYFYVYFSTAINFIFGFIILIKLIPFCFIGYQILALLLVLFIYQLSLIRQHLGCSIWFCVNIYIMWISRVLDTGY